MRSNLFACDFFMASDALEMDLMLLRLIEQSLKSMFSISYAKFIWLHTIKTLTYILLVRLLSIFLASRDENLWCWDRFLVSYYPKWKLEDIGKRAALVTEDESWLSVNCRLNSFMISKTLSFYCLIFSIKSFCRSSSVSNLNWSFFNKFFISVNGFLSANFSSFSSLRATGCASI